MDYLNVSMPAPATLKTGAENRDLAATPEHERTKLGAVEDAPPVYNTREEVLRACFEHIDADASGILDIPELRAVLVARTPTQNLTAAQEFMAFLDENEDGMVTLDEFLASAEAPSLAEMTDAEFIQMFEMLMKTDEPTYVHPTDTRAYLEENVAPILRQGLEELLRVVEEDRLDVAAGKQWDADGTLPEEWLPFQALRWLGNWLMEPAKLVDERNTTFQGPVLYRDLSPEEQLETVFRHVDKDDNGFLTFDEVLGLVNMLLPQSSEEDAHRFLEKMDENGDEVLTMEEFVPHVKTILFDMNEGDREAVTVECMRILGAKHLRVFSRQDKLRICFAHMDIDRSGELTTDELTRVASALTSEEAAEALEKGKEDAVEAQRVYEEAEADGSNPKRTAKKLKKLEAAKKQVQKLEKGLERAQQAEVQVNTAFGRMDTDGSGQISSREFIETMISLTSDLTDEMFDLGVARLLGKNPVDDDNDPMIEMDPTFAEYVRGFATYKLVKHISPAKLETLINEKSVNILLIDVRTKMEQGVSSIKDSLKVQMDLDEADKLVATSGEIELNKSTLNLVAIKQYIKSYIPADGGELLICCYDSCGFRGSLLARALVLMGAGELVDNQCDLQMFNLCGGIVEWYNRDKKVVNAEGVSVTFLHPGAHRCEQYVTRKNDFKLPKRRVKKSRGKMSSAQSSRGSLGSRGTDRQTPVTPASKVA